MQDRNRPAGEERRSKECDFLFAVMWLGPSQDSVLIRAMWGQSFAPLWRAQHSKFLVGQGDQVLTVILCFSIFTISKFLSLINSPIPAILLECHRQTK